MKGNSFPNSNSKKIVHLKTGYSHITSRLFSSLSKSKEKLPLPKKQIIPPTIKLSIEKVQQITDQKYKQAMKHVEKFKKYDEQIKRRKIQQKPDSECTFKPKIIKNKKYNPTARFMNISFTQKNLIRSKDFTPKKSFFKEGSFTQRTNLQDKKQESKPKKKILGQKLAQRLMNWGKDRDTKIANKKFQAEASKSISRNSSVGSQKQRKSTLSKQKSYRQLYQKKLQITIPKQISNTENNPLSNSYVKGYEDFTTPRKSARTNNQMARSMISFHSPNSVKTTKRNELVEGLLQEIKYDKIEQKQKDTEKDLFLKKRTQFYSEISSSLNAIQTIGEKMLLNQTARGEGSFYLRQAKANISKNYKKTDVLVKNKHYSQKFSTKYVNAVVLRDKNIQK